MRAEATLSTGEADGEGEEDGILRGILEGSESVMLREEPGLVADEQV